MQNKKRTWGIVLAVVLVLAILAGAGGNHAVTSSFPQVDGTIQLAGLEGPVTVYRDKMGVPHIYATNSHDLFMAQGYIHAQDRFWQMDFWRHTGSGRLAEMFGKGQVETDMFLRTLGWRELAEQEYESADPEARAILQAYADGVNAYLQGREGAQLSLEYVVLGLLTPSYKPEPWTPVHSLTWAKAMAWDLKGNINQEIERAILLKTLPAEAVDELYPPYPADHPVIVPVIGENAPAAGSPAPLSVIQAVPAAQFEAVHARLLALETLLGPSGNDIGSNNWVVSGDLTSTGKPLLANDPHLGIQMPSIWYQVSLQCQPVGEDCPYNVTGFSFAGVPGVIVGYNDSIAWGVTNVGPDVMDLYIEKINPENPNQYEYKGEWVDMDIRTETIQVGGGEPVEITIRSTIHGPIISDSYGPLKPRAVPTDGPELPFEERAGGLEFPEEYAIALRWTALEPVRVFRAVWSFNKAQNWEEFRTAAADFAVPAQNLVYADVEGNIGYQMPGNIPIRLNGDGRLPVPGWTGEYDWQGYVPFEELPYVFNPQSGYVATANNQVEPREGYPYLISTDYDLGYRANRIVEMIEEAPGPIDVAYFQKMHADAYDGSAAVIVPYLLALDITQAELAGTRRILEGWDYQMAADSAPAALYAAFWNRFLTNTFADELPENMPPTGSSRWFEVMRRIIADNDNRWFDDVRTPDVIETRDDIMAASFEQAVVDVKIRLRADITQWRWGDLHVANFENQTLGQSGIAPIESLFNRNGFGTGGGASIVNATGWRVGGGFEVTSVPSFRMIVDFSDFDNSLGIHTTGQSGHAYHPHYIDMAPLWARVEYAPMLWTEGQISDSAASVLQLVPELP